MEVIKISDKPSKAYHDMEMEIDKLEVQQLINYFDKNITEDELTQLKVEWTIDNLLKKVIKDSKDRINDKITELKAKKPAVH